MSKYHENPIDPIRTVHDDEFMNPPEIHGLQIGRAMINDAGILLNFYEVKYPKGYEYLIPGRSLVRSYCGSIAAGIYGNDWVYKIGDGSYDEGISTIKLDYYNNVTREMVRAGVARNVCWFANLSSYRKISE